MSLSAHPASRKCCTASSTSGRHSWFERAASWERSYRKLPQFNSTCAYMKYSSPLPAPASASVAGSAASPLVLASFSLFSAAGALMSALASEGAASASPALSPALGRTLRSFSGTAATMRSTYSKHFFQCPSPPFACSGDSASMALHWAAAVHSCSSRCTSCCSFCASASVLEAFSAFSSSGLSAGLRAPTLRPAASLARSISREARYCRVSTCSPFTASASLYFFSA
mmetsp:Transcript_14445/g.43689  ORF Transcript_14445/g.43689 Transcript_14445/m.43689 type:complete len:228 (+) Transcript_14445:1059-1742(+)